MSEIFREIEEELRRDNLLKLWSRYGRYIIMAVVAVLVLAGGFVAWRDHHAGNRKAVSTRYYGAMALVGEGKDADAITLLATVIQEGGGYAVLARFDEAELRAKAGDRAGTQAIYDRIAAAGDVDSEFRDLAVLLSVMRGLTDTDAKVSIARLEPLTASGKPWRATALELTAAARLKAGDKAAALEIYKSLADDLTAPEGLRGRAAEMATALSQ